jgi:predicted ATP-grasp superfamily ATP-dependent carboligase
MDTNKLTWLEKPVLINPYLILAFSGWSNAGEVPSSVLWYLLSRLKSTLFAQLPPDDYYVYLSAKSEATRPVVNIEDGLILSYNPVTLNFWGHQSTTGGHDLIMVSGPEPEQRWNQMSELLMELVKEYNVVKIILLGGSFDSIPHTAPPRITGVANCLEEKAGLKAHNIEMVNYKGPSSFYTLLMVNAQKQNIPAAGLWAHTPHYIQVTNFIGCYHLMLKLNDWLGLGLDLEVAKKDADFLYQQIDQAIHKKPDLVEMLKKLEADFRKSNPGPGSPINQTILNEIEDLFSDK